MKTNFFPRRLLAACAFALFAALAARADPAPVKLALFDFELDDFSGGGGGIAGDPAADLKHLDEVTAEARKLIAASGRYALVDVAGAEGEGVKDRTLRQCHGCEAAIALKLGADQSFLGDRDADHPHRLCRAVRASATPTPAPSSSSSQATCASARIIPGFAAPAR